jgi:hypothetical protein
MLLASTDFDVVKYGVKQNGAVEILWQIEFLTHQGSSGVIRS